MKRRNPRAIIFTLPTYEAHAPAAQPRILPFPGSRETQPLKVAPERDVDEIDPALGEVRERLFRMIVANQWDRSHGNRAS